MSYYGGYNGFGYSNYGNSFARDYNGDGLITASDFREGAYRMGLGPVGADVAQSAFNAFDRNHNGYLDRNDAYGAYGYLHRLYY
jgi:hypothetical protein